MTFEESMRWFGPSDPVSLSDIKQAGCVAVVTALHDVAVGEVWQKVEIRERKTLIQNKGLKWNVVESLPVHEDIKTKTGDYLRYIENYIESIKNLASEGLKVITYNFMPLFDWIRTDLTFQLKNGSLALRFDKQAFIAVDVFLLKRFNAKDSYTIEEVINAQSFLDSLSISDMEKLLATVLQSLPGSSEPFSIDYVNKMLKTYEHVSAKILQENLFFFLKNIIPIAESLNIKMAIHPDDPPFKIFGLPRIVSTENQINEILNSVKSTANGLCFCTGSLGVRKENDLISMVKKFGHAIYFAHLRSVKTDDFGNFYEANHLEGDTIFEVVKQFVLVFAQTNYRIPMRPDHGHQMLDDLHKKTYPGYSAIGRLKGLAELRGLEMGIRLSI